MPRFLAGFVLGSLVWGVGLWAARSTGLIELGWRPAPAAVAEAPQAAPNAGKRDPDARKRRRRSTQPSAPRGPRAPGGEATSGDDLDLDEPRELDLERGGGEEQLLDREIEQAFNQNFPQVRRCLVLAASDQAVRGTVTFGLRISGRQGVTAVNLKGPGAVTTGEAGDCLRKAARALRLRSFDGPDMVVHYPLVLN